MDPWSRYYRCLPLAVAISLALFTPLHATEPGPTVETIRSAVASFLVGDLAVNLVDTPGHPDFIAEVERVLGVLDGAILVVSAVEGVQPQTPLLFRALQRLHVPALIFVNKVDRAGADPERVLGEMRRRLSPGVVADQRRDLLLEVLAERDDRSALTKRETYGEAAGNLALVLVNRGRADEATRLLETFLAKVPAFEGTYVMLARIHLSSGRTREGLAVLERLLQRNPTHPLALEMIKQFRER